jgi:nicotinamidase-related amidase
MKETGLTSVPSPGESSPDIHARAVILGFDPRRPAGVSVSRTLYQNIRVVLGLDPRTHSVVAEASLLGPRVKPEGDAMKQSGDGSSEAGTFGRRSRARPGNNQAAPSRGRDCPQPGTAKYFRVESHEKQRRFIRGRPAMEGNMRASINKCLGILATAVAIGFSWPLSDSLAQTARPASVLPSGGGQALIDTSDTVFLLLDHQSGLFQTVKDISVAELRANTIMLARLATLLKIPVITTASEPNGPNGPLMPEIHQYAPHAVYVPRKGEVNAWDNDDFVNAVRATGKRTLIMAGVWTSVCVMFPALDAKAAGYKVYAVMDASGDPSEMASRTTLGRFVQAGVVPTSTNAVLSETHRTWNRPEAAELAKLYALVAPNYQAVIESYQKAQEAAKGSK